MIIRLLLLSIFIGSQTLQAQEVDHAFTVGTGLTNVYDSYLSPLEYKGWEIRAQRETLRPTRLLDGKVQVQSILNLHASYTKNPSKSGKMYEGLLNWNINWLYTWHKSPKWDILAGPMIDLNGGVIYNKRNSNNPAQGKVYANIGVSGMVGYHFKLFNQAFRLRYELSAPLVGVMFSPEYGESYYEMFGLKKGGWHNVCLTTPLSQPSIRNSLYLDFTWHRTNLRIGYIGDIQQSRAKGIRSHTYSHTIMIGYIKQFQISKKPIQ